jgi:hypothetical protein
MKSMSLANDAGKPCNPIGVTLHCYLAPLPGTDKAVYCLLFSWRDCCQKPEVKSNVENISNLDLTNLVQALPDLLDTIPIRERLEIYCSKIEYYAKKIKSRG